MKMHPKRARTVARCAMAGVMSLAVAGAVAVPTAASGAVGWSVVSSLGGSSVSCVSASDCWAVGGSSIDNWDGTVWATVTQVTGILNSVTCVGASDCWAVGTTSVYATDTLAEHWDGNVWSVVNSADARPADPFDATSNSLQGVACTSTSDCWAVGIYCCNSERNADAFIDHWDGSVWAFYTEYNNEFTLRGVTCVSVSDCWAVGNVTIGWNGTQWNRDAGGGGASGVTCVSANDCWAVSGSGFQQWNGSVWSNVTGPPVGGQLQGVTCVSASDCWAVGGSSIDYWDGTVWSVVSSPADSLRQGVTCVSAGDCWAVGGSIEHYATATTISTSPASMSILFGQSITDAATVAGDATLGSPTGTISFFLCGPLTSATGCPSGGTVVGSAVPVTPSANGTATATSALFTPSSGGTWCFRGEYTGDGSYLPSSDGSVSECFTVISATTFQEASPSVTLNSWHGFTDPAASGGTYRASATKAANATFKFSGTGITWVTRKAPDQGIASVTIDGIAKGNVDLYSASPQSLSQSYSGLASKTHTIVITVTGTKNAASSGKQVAVDAFVVGFTTTEDTSTKVTYDTWKGVSSTSASGGTYRVSPKKGATSRLSFTGTGVDWITATGPSAGIASVTIDGISMGTVDLYAPTVHWQVTESYAGFALVNHTIVVTVLGAKNASSTSTLVVVDAFIAHQ